MLNFKKEIKKLEEKINKAENVERNDFHTAMEHIIVLTKMIMREYIKNFETENCPFCGESTVLHGKIAREDSTIDGFGKIFIFSPVCDLSEYYQVKCENEQCKIKPKTDWLKTPEDALTSFSTKCKV